MPRHLATCVSRSERAASAAVNATKPVTETPVLCAPVPLRPGAHSARVFLARLMLFSFVVVNALAIIALALSKPGVP